LFYSLFELIKNKEELEFTVSDSLNLYEKDDPFILFIPKRIKKIKKDGWEIVNSYLYLWQQFVSPLNKEHCSKSLSLHFWVIAWP